MWYFHFCRYGWMGHWEGFDPTVNYFSPILKKFSGKLLSSRDYLKRECSKSLIIHGSPSGLHMLRVFLLSRYALLNAHQQNIFHDTLPYWHFFIFGQNFCLRYLWSEIFGDDANIGHNFCFRPHLFSPKKSSVLPHAHNQIGKASQTKILLRSLN